MLKRFSSEQLGWWKGGDQIFSMHNSISEMAQRSHAVNVLRKFGITNTRLTKCDQQHFGCDCTFNDYVHRSKSCQRSTKRMACDLKLFAWKGFLNKIQHRKEVQYFPVRAPPPSFDFSENLFLRAVFGVEQESNVIFPIWGIGTKIWHFLQWNIWVYRFHLTFKRF